MSKKSEITEYFVFNREWYDLKKTVSKKVWDKLFDLMLQLRFDGLDTDPTTIKSKTVRSYWVMIRIRILNSMERCERKKEERKRKMETSTESQQDMQPNTEFDLEVENKPNKTVITAEYPNPQPITESPSEGQESGKNEVMEQPSIKVDEEDENDADLRYGYSTIEDTPKDQWWLFDDDVVETYQRKMKEENNLIYNLINNSDMVVNSEEYVDDIARMIKKATVNGAMDWSVIRDGVNSIAVKHNVSRADVHNLIQIVLTNMQAA